jgi:nucleoside-triphosphatase THEP1
VRVQSRGVIYILTGDRGSGKSTVCARVAREAALRDLAVTGILTERGDAADPASARRVVDLRTGDARLFGAQDRECSRERAQDGSQAPNSAATSDPLTPGWEFDSGVFAWANEALGRSTPCDLLVIDEIGPLELLGGRGWVKALEVLISTGFRAALVVCRPGLLEELQKRLCGAALTIIEVTRETRDELPDTIVERLLGPNAGT